MGVFFKGKDGVNNFLALYYFNMILFFCEGFLLLSLSVWLNVVEIPPLDFVRGIALRSEWQVTGASKLQRNKNAAAFRETLPSATMSLWSPTSLDNTL